MVAREKGAVLLPETTANATDRRMGRPPLNHVRIPVRLAQEAIDEIDERVGTYGRAKFIRQAVEEKLARDKL